jgi:hypothetical protein
MKTYNEANEVGKQITKACEDCPMRRKALPGWLADMTPAEYCNMLHSETHIECHTKLCDGEPVLCAGAAIYRANVAKSSPDLKLPADRELVFASPIEFMRHHLRQPKKTAAVIGRMLLRAFEKQFLWSGEDTGKYHDKARKRKRSVKDDR